VRALGLMANDDRARRAWLWLRAREKEDDETLACLERGEPGLAERMSEHDARAARFEDPRRRREAYGRMMDELVLEVARLSCGCAACARADPRR
jgi:hypothetical protein